MAFKARAQRTDAPPAFTSILDRQGSIRENSKEPGLIPTGPWLLGAISAKMSKKTRETDDGQEVEYEQIVFVHEPLEPTSGVDQEDAEAVDENGRSLFDGKRIFTRLNMDFAGSMGALAQILDAHGYDLDEPLGDTIVSLNNGSIKGRRAYGDVQVKTFKRQDGSNGRDNEVKSWTSVEAMEKLQADDESF